MNILDNINVLNMVSLPSQTIEIIVRNFILCTIVGLIIIVIGLVYSYYKTDLVEKRLAKYCVKPLEDNSLSFFDKIGYFYYKLVKRISFVIKKSSLFSKKAQNYEKYVGILNNNYEKGIDYISSKFIFAILLTILAFISEALTNNLLALYELVIPLVIGYFIPDILYKFKYKMHRNTIENDLLQAIIIMNNAFKSGRSLTQAISLASNELTGPISYEFKKMDQEIAYGLGVEVVFKRFADRIKLDEINYLTASLSVLNKTGGNIIKVFTTIEKSLFDKKRLRLELDSLTGSSKLIMYCLITVPILFVFFISIINPGYFKVFYTTLAGFIILMIITLLYITYIIFIRKIMKVRM